MVKLNIDLRFAIIATETFVAKRLADVGLTRLEGTDKDVRRLVLDELKAAGYEHDEVERDIAYQEIYFLEDEVPRLETYGILFVLFATYESVIKRLPRYVGDWTPADVTKKKGDNFISKVARFYKDDLGVPLFSDGSQEKSVRLIADIRNAVGHATGRVSMLKKGLRKRLETAADLQGGIKIVDGSLQLAAEYVRGAAVTLDDAAKQLIERLKASF